VAAVAAAGAEVFMGGWRGGSPEEGLGRWIRGGRRGVESSGVVGARLRVADADGSL
jgi:hypothetical protein